MSFTPANIQALNKLDKFQTWKQDVIEVKHLFLQSKYKKCISRCEEFLKYATHPVHKTFLHFYQAICYELTGIAAHSYSSNKIPLLTFAERSFELALETLPRPYMPIEFQQNSMSKSTPLCATFDILQQYHGFSSALQEVTPCPLSRRTRRDCIGSAPSVYSEHGSIRGSNIQQTLKFGDHSPCPATIARAVEDSIEQTPPTPTISRLQERKNRTKVRFSQSVSSDHIVIEELIPSPLFKTLKPISTISAVLETTPLRRPLPPLPINHKSIALQDNDYQIPTPIGRHCQRQPIIQKLAFKFEPDTTPTTSPPYPSPSGLLIETQTLQQLSINSNNNNNDIDTARHLSPDIINLHLSTYLSSTSTSKYNATLLSFRTRINHHLVHVKHLIDLTSRNQRTHELGRNLRVASFWSFKPADNNNNNNHGNHVNNSSEMTRKERKAKLKENGWKVNKERHGWKGKEYYEMMRKRAEDDLVS